MAQRPLLPPEMPDGPVSMGLGWALVPVGVLIALLGLHVVLFGADSSYGPNQMAMLLAAFVAAAIGMAKGVAWGKVAEAIGKSIASTSEAILILLLIGALSGTWLIAGIIPAFMYYGLQVLEPGIFLFAACIICSTLSLATGTSWGTVGTVGVALMGIGAALGLEPGWVAGAIISGAYFGDKLSPMSDTTNIAPAVAGTDLFTHIRYMLYTTVPSMVVTLAVFLVAGLGGGAAAGGAVPGLAPGFEEAVRGAFQIHAGLFIAPIVVIGLIIKKVPAAPALLVGVLLGALTAVLFQPQLIATLSNGIGGWAGYRVAMQAMFGDIAVETGHPLADGLLQSDGMAGMLNTVWLILCAMVFGAALEATGMLRAITAALLRGVQSTFGLVSRTVGTCLAFNILASDQYLAIVVPGNMYRKAFEDADLAPENLSRTLEDAGTVTSVLVPWNTCGVAQSGMLGIATWAYLPYCIFNWVSPLMTLLVAAVGFRIRKLGPTPVELQGAAKG
jgi:NhaC family Na+:H+ antiporter